MPSMEHAQAQGNEYAFLIDSACYAQPFVSPELARQRS